MRTYNTISSHTDHFEIQKGIQNEISKCYFKMFNKLPGSVRYKWPGMYFLCRIHAKVLILLRFAP